MKEHKDFNEHTGALLVSKPATEAYNAGWDRIFGKRVTCCKCGDVVGVDNSSSYDGDTYCRQCLEKMYED